MNFFIGNLLNVSDNSRAPFMQLPGTKGIFTKSLHLYSSDDELRQTGRGTSIAP